MRTLQNALMRSIAVSLLAGSMFAQTPMPVKAGDPAPYLTWTKIVASDSTSAGPRSLSGQTTVLLFLRPVSVNGDAVSSWNKLVEQFRDKPVNFVWIANEKEDELAPFLKTHPVRGWMVLDPEEQSYKAYGIESGDGVLIDKGGVIVGFTSLSPDQNQIQAVLDGRAVAVKGEPTDAQLDAFFDGKAVRLDAEPSRSPSPPEKPNVPPSDEAHISPSHTEGTESSSGPDHWMYRGFDLKAILSELLATNQSRIDLSPALDNKARYDFVLVPPREEDTETMQRQMLAGIEKYFHVAITQETRSMDVYVMTAIEGKTPPRKSEEEAMGGSMFAISSSVRMSGASKPEEPAPRTRKEAEEANRKVMESPEFRQAVAMAQLTSASAFSTSVDDFCRGLEDGLHRPVINETRLSGYYDFKTQGEAQTTEEFISMLRDQLGLVLTRAQRDIEMTVVHPDRQ